MDYTPKYFDPVERGGARLEKSPELIAFGWGDGQARDVYVFEPRVILAVNVAMATRRPLLISGEPGSGKTRLATAVAQVLGWQYYPRTVTSRTEAADLLWTFDALGRLNDATTPKRTLKADQLYVVPGGVWWGFSPGTAQHRGLKRLENAADRIDNPSKTGAGGAVVLVDELDKADPDVPNDLLEPFDVRQFTVKETNDTITAERDVFLVLTTNGERELPPAFIRRCVTVALADPDQNWFERVALQHFPRGDQTLHAQVAREVQRLRDETKPGARKPSTAEFLDALRVCDDLETSPSKTSWRDVVDAVLLKREQFGATRAGQRAVPAISQNA